MLNRRVFMKCYNLVFEGGGVKGIAYVGVLEALTTIPLKSYGEPINLIQDIKSHSEIFAANRCMNPRT